MGVVVISLLACGIEVGIGDTDAVAAEAVWVSESLVQDSAPAVDVLFVVDGTGSMGEERASLAASAGKFIEALEADSLDWQLAATSTDLVDAGVLHGDPWILTPQTESPAAALAAALDIGADHPPPSAGLDAAVLTMRDETGQNHGFRRENAALHVVFVSDGEDQSGMVLGSNPVDGFVALLEAEAARTGQPARASAVVGEAPDGCDGATGEASAGLRYLAVADRSGGAQVSVCDADFSAVADRIGELAVTWPTRFPLQGIPAVGTVSVTVDGVRNEDFDVDYAEAAVTFDAPPAPYSTVEVRYQLAEGEG